MNLKKLSPVVSLDSAIERTFYERCCKDEVYTNILIEWINTKPVYANYTQMIMKSYGNYSKHDQSHSISILESIYAIIGKKRVARMDIMDLWLLLHCAYAHDIGMPYTYDEAKRFWDSINETESMFRKFLEECLASSKDNDAKEAAEYIIAASKRMKSPDLGELAGKRAETKYSLEKPTSRWPLEVGRYCEYLTTEYCRKNHTNRSEEFMTKKADGVVYNTPYVLSSRFYKIIAKCSMVHGENFDSVMRLDEDEWAKEGKCHPAFVAALLRLGDLLDIDNNRFDSIVLEYYGRLPQISELHKMKHEAITHINLAEDKIEVTAKSVNLDVCKCISDWFSYIDQEVKDLIFAWGQIAPEKMKGCKLTIPILKNYYCNQEFSDYESQEFNVNKEMLINLVIGRNLYNSKLDFIREYLQNSMDALKMKFWMDLEDGFLDIEIKREVLKKIKDDKFQAGPLDFAPSTFFRYGIDIYCKLIEENDMAYIEVSINDRGIGIDEECLKAISNIGSGWKKREKYRRHLDNMPLWLKPTGGFGIGMQSGFMAADEIVIVTKCENESIGRKITLHSTVNSGKVEEQRYEVRHTGTTVIVKIPYEQFMDSCEYKNHKLLKDKIYGDFFDTNEIIQGVTEIIFNYVSYVVKGSVFPISVRRIGFEPKELPQKFQKETKLLDEVEIEGKHYQFYKEDRSEIIYIWQVEDAVLCTLGNEKESEVLWYYKGVRVCDADTPDVSYLLYVFLSITIDIMGIRVSECLTVDRSKFLAKFDYEKLLCEFVSAYFNSDVMVEDWLNNNEQKLDGNINNYYKIIFAFIYCKSEKSRTRINHDMKKFIGPNMRLNVLGAVIKTIKKATNNVLYNVNLMEEMEGDEHSIKKEPEVQWGMQSLYDVCRELWNHSEIYIIKNNNLLENMIEDYLKSTTIIEIEGKTLVISAELYECFKHFYINNIRKIYNGIMSKDSIKCELEILKYCDRQVESEEELQKSGISSRATHEIYWVNNRYVELQVKTLPWGYKEPIAIIGNEKRNMIISPIRPMYSDEELLRSALKDKEDPFSEFKNLIMDNKNFTYLINWVYSHQLVENKYTKEVIREKYEAFLEEWFNTKIDCKS